MNAPVTLRVAALSLMQRLHQSSGSMSRLLPVALASVAEKDRPQLQAWSYGLARFSGELKGFVDQLLDKPLKAKDLDVYLLMQLGVFQLRHTPVSAHAAVDETVKVVKQLKKPWARGLVNAVLRNYQRRTGELEQALGDSQRLSHPDWLLRRIQSDWPQQWEEICQANNTQGPMTLRVNQRASSTDDYQRTLAQAGFNASVVAGAPQALQLAAPIPVQQLPGFGQGHVSVQDAAAQLAAAYLGRYAKSGGCLLDACSAPGGKTAHALESGVFDHVVALDQDGERLQRVAETLERIGYSSQTRLQAVDALQLDEWWDGTAFEAVLLDAPCSGTGVIRRHPDIKLLRRDSDIDNLIRTQAELLDRLWTTVAIDGVLLYATCSILKDENERQVQRFLIRTPNAKLACDMRQILPGEQGMDGFFYAPLIRCQ